MGFSAVFRQLFLEVDGDPFNSGFSAMEEVKSNETVIKNEKMRSVDRRQLEVQGEALEAVEKTYGIWQSVKLSKHALVYMVAAYLCAATYGYDTIANGATIAMPSFEMYFGKYDPIRKILYLPSIWTSLWNSMSGLGQVLGSAAAGPLSQNVGRRYAGIAFAAVTIVGVSLQYVATSKGELLAGKMINGVAVGGLISVGTTYASEVAPIRLRGLLLSGLAFFVVVMQAMGLGVVRAFVPDLRPLAFRTAFALQWLVGGLPMIAFFLVPESPNYLLLKGRKEAAHNSMARIYGKANHVDARLAHLQSGIQHEMRQDQKATYLDCFRGTDRKRTLTVWLLQLGNSLIGSALLTQNIYFLTLGGLPVIHAFDINIGGFCLALVIMPFTWYFGDKVGRRPLYLGGVIGNIIAMGVIGGLGYTPTSDKGAIWAIAVLLNLLITWQIFTVVLISWSMPPEISSYRLRQLTQSISVITSAFTSWLFQFCTPYMYNVGAGSGNLGAKTGFVFMGTSVVLLLLAWVYIPETRGLSTEVIDGLYEGGVKPRRFGRVEREGEELCRGARKVELSSQSRKSEGC
ncbi:MFS general substrate transporter [Hyaloscypha variabilis F]|uniref:MFS general substrate transporter n=1 Tax=Hyaloscypha variabilis (strain UAMH 11265 / GT02V1 / F) TaxID=1149755 RepID=A0A2J6S2H5_HYAVF|nr:MFS general substrate transporter [Hyaloscypha variabilis F]